MARPSPYPPELRERAVRMVSEIRPHYSAEWAAMKAVAAKLGIGAAETVRTWFRKAEVDAGQRAGVTSEEAAEIKRLRAENAELRRANEILKAAAVHSTGQRNIPGRTGAGGVAWRGWAVRGCRTFRSVSCGIGGSRANRSVRSPGRWASRRVPCSRS